MWQMVVAVDSDGGIGKDNKLLVDNKEDLQWFQFITSSSVLLMGRNTWESLPSKPLKGRPNIVLSTKSDFILEDAQVLPSLDSAESFIISQLGDLPVSVIGGARLYADAINRCDLLYITEYEHSFLHDVEFPAIPKVFACIAESDKLYFDNIPYNVRIFMNKSRLSLTSAKNYLKMLISYKIKFNFVDSV